VYYRNQFKSIEKSNLEKVNTTSGRPLRTAYESPSSSTRRNLVGPTANETNSVEKDRREDGRAIRNTVHVHVGLSYSKVIHSFIQAVSIAPLQVHYYSEELPTQHGDCVGVSRRCATGICEWRTCPKSLHGG